MNEILAICMFVFSLLILSFGFPVAYSLGGSALFFGGFSYLLGAFDPVFLSALPERLFGIFTNESLVAIPMFVFMGLVLESSKISEDLLIGISKIFGKFKGGLGLSVFVVGTLLAASTGIVGATVVSMGLISLPLLLKKNYPKTLSTGMICASGTLGQIIPPSIVLIILGDVISSANQQAQLVGGVFNVRTVSVGDLFVGAILPGLMLVSFYMIYVLIYSYFKLDVKNLEESDLLEIDNHTNPFLSTLPPLLLILCVLGSILKGVATPTEAASLGGVGALTLAFLKNKLNFKILHKICLETMEVTSMVFIILIGASVFSLVFRGLNGDEFIQSLLLSSGDSVAWSFFIVMLVIFILGFFLDFFEITFVVVPIVGPGLIQMGLDPLWLGVMIAMNLQTSFLTPPFGFSLFYLRGVAPKDIETKDIYWGVTPFILLQLLCMFIIYFYPSIVTWLPNYLMN